MKWGLEQFCHYILGRKIKVVTDHANLRWLTSISPKQSKLARWCISMAEFDFTIEHRAGKEHVVPDTLSRAPLPNQLVVGDSLVIPPPEVSPFLITALGYDVPGHTPTLVSQVFDPALQCIALSCDVNPPSFHHCLIRFFLHIRLRLFPPQKSFSKLTTQYKQVQLLGHLI